MWTPNVTEATSATEVSPELLKPLVAVVATLGKLGATARDVPLAKPWGSLRAGLLNFSSGVREAMRHRHGEATRLRRTLSAAAQPTAEGPGVPKATAVAIACEWLKAVASVEAAWAKLKVEAAGLKDACEVAAAAGAAAGATAEATVGHLMGAVALETEARGGFLRATHLLPMTLEPTEVVEVVAAHDARVAEAQSGLQEASKATEEAAAAAVAAVTARERGRQAAVAHELLGDLVVACDGAYHYYCHLQRRVKDIEAMVAPKATQGDPGIPKGLAEAVAVAEALWGASACLAQEHLLGTLRVVRGLLSTGDTTEATAVAQRCQDATTALPGLLPKGLS
ncbi:uncharacterized protein LOC118158745 isoform X2 [Oxyura jamaicensis]|uniref:uncharacterized protein LOC118158745 isoform X2 n=1 Tax=Oxyura jamaicensis TaxID=8884 RepID=UPI0015A5E31C|nr:uncharacterized protein LOC118158745 isoform X2 [Oxyura jamaicensis]